MAEAIFDFKSNLNLKPMEKLGKLSVDILTGYSDHIIHPARQYNEYQLGIFRRAGVDPQTASKQSAEIARKLTYGDETTPARPFLEEGIWAEKDDISELVADAFANKIDSTKTGSAEAVGVACVAAVKKFMLQTNDYRQSVPNAGFTIAVKSHSQGKQTLKSDKPLIDTGLLAQQTMFEVRE